MDRQRRVRGAEIALIYIAAFGQGAGFVFFPALGNIFKSPDHHHLTSGEYGLLFLPMIVCAILASSLGGALARRWGLKRVLLAGMGTYTAALLVLALSQLFVGPGGAAKGLVFAAIMLLGIALGATLTALNAYAAAFFSGRSEAALTGLYATMGLGMALAPLLVGVFVGRGVWWGVPLAGGLYYLSVLLVGLALPLAVAVAETEAATFAAQVRKLPPRFWGYAGLILFYGICETAFGHWAVIYLHEDKGLSVQWAGFALSAFWGMLMMGRILASILSLYYPVRALLVGLPLLTLATFVALPLVSGTVGNVIAFGLGGLACSAILPLGISFAEQEAPEARELVSGWMITAVMLGVGIGAYGIGVLRDTGGLGFSTIYAGAGLFAAAMAALASHLMFTPAVVQPQAPAFRAGQDIEP